MERVQMAAFEGLRRGLVGGSQSGEAAAGRVRVRVFFDFAAGGRVPGVLYGSGPPDAPGCLLVAMRRVGAGLDWPEVSLPRGVPTLMRLLPTWGGPGRVRMVPPGSGFAHPGLGT